MAEPVYISMITRGIIDQLYHLQEIKNFHRAMEARRTRRYVGWDMMLPGGLVLERIEKTSAVHTSDP